MTPASPGLYPSPAKARVVLAMLLLVYIFNFLDRQILGILAGPIKADLHLTDAQFGAIGGLAFALLYSVLGVPLAVLADRTTRSGVIAGALVVWSAFTALCGVATSYGQLFLFRLGVGVGEAGGAAPSYALISDYFPPERRARALAIYSMGVPLGLAGGVLLGGYLAQLVEWRTAFLTVGIAGIAIAPLFRWLVRDLPHPAVLAAEKVHPREVFAILFRKPAFWLLAFAAGCSSLCGYGLALWTPSVLIRSYGFDLITTGQFLGSLLLIGGATGVFVGGALADRLGRRDRAWYAWLPAIAWTITVPTFAAGLLSPNPWVAWPLLLIPNALNIFWLGPISAAVQHLVPARMRATAGGSFLLINNLLGLGVGPLLMGTISDRLKGSYGIDSLRNAAVACLAFYALAAVLGLVAGRFVQRGWVEDEHP
jgi:predicted MFS family arabinose efflux permease